MELVKKTYPTPQKLSNLPSVISLSAKIIQISALNGATALTSLYGIVNDKEFIKVLR
jgi:hypothetical protein